MRSIFTGVALATAAAVALWSCGGGGGTSVSTPATPSAPSAPMAQALTVAIVGSSGNQAYRPNPVAANAGDTVMFRNNDTAMHHIVLDDGSADLGAVGPGATSKGVTLRTANATTFHCSIHPSMVGSINGREAPQPPPCADPSGYGC
jgi:plastocyanin